MRLEPLLVGTRRAAQILARDGVAELGSRAVRRLGQSVSPSHLDLPMKPADMADSYALVPPAPPRRVDGPLRIGWVTTPPSAGSGGHTTMLRMVEGLERAGHTCSIYFYDRFGGRLQDHASILHRHWPGVRATAHDALEGMPELDAWVATSWQTAHLLANRPAAGGHRFYFVQDFEPFFYPRGAEYALSEDTYRFGFRGLTAGSWLSDVLTRDYGMPCDAFEFGADTDTYAVLPSGTRNGVVFYCKPHVSRRGYVLGTMVLEEFARRHPEAPIHLFGEPAGKLSFDAVSHGHLSPAALSELYNRCRVGLSLSFTNVSLIPWELLACGVLPVVNDADHNRRVLFNDRVVWAPPSVSALADGMSAAYELNTTATTASALAASVMADRWSDAAAAVVASIERQVAS